jgi:hypothetical protein
MTPMSKSGSTAMNCPPMTSTMNKPVEFFDPPAVTGVRRFNRAVKVLVEDSHNGSNIFNEYNFGSAQLGRVLKAQGANVYSTAKAPRYEEGAGLTRSLLSYFDMVIFNGRFNGRTRPFTQAEIDAVAEWVKAGGGLLVTCSSPSASDKMDAFYMNPLIAPYGLQFASRAVKEGFYRVQPTDTHELLKGLTGFTMMHGIAVAGQATAQDVLPSGPDTVMMTQQFGQGRVIVFGAGSAIKNQALNSRVIRHATAETTQANTQLLMNLSLWLTAER